MTPEGMEVIKQNGPHGAGVKKMPEWAAGLRMARMKERTL